VGEFEFLDSVAIADCAVEVPGHDLDDLFETAARALAELMVDPPTVPRVSERCVTLSASSLDMLRHVRGVGGKHEVDELHEAAGHRAGRALDHAASGAAASCGDCSTFHAASDHTSSRSWRAPSKRA
jgi:hypothetical protein